jgi:hypothetical protein
MASAVQLAKQAGAKLDPALKEFLDVVVIPALVKAYLKEGEAEKRLVIVPNNVRQSGSEASLPIEGVL